MHLDVALKAYISRARAYVQRVCAGDELPPNMRLPGGKVTPRKRKPGRGQLPRLQYARVRKSAKYQPRLLCRARVTQVDLHHLTAIVPAAVGKGDCKGEDLLTRRALNGDVHVLRR